MSIYTEKCERHLREMAERKYHGDDERSAEWAVVQISMLRTVLAQLLKNYDYDPDLIDKAHWEAAREALEGKP